MLLPNCGRLKTMIGGVSLPIAFCASSSLRMPRAHGSCLVLGRGLTAIEGPCVSSLKQTMKTASNCIGAGFAGLVQNWVHAGWLKYFIK